MMKKSFPIVALALLCAVQTAFSQLPAGLKPLPSNINKNSYPAVTQDLRVVFRLRAPQADRVQIDLGRRYDMTRDAEGFWTVTTDPQEEGFHYYSLILDGVAVADPASESFYGMGRMASAVDIPERGVDFYDVKEVPRGALRSDYYFSNVTNSWRHMYVYTPPGYDQDTRRYPVMYIQHGGGEDERGWATQGHTDIILDNLIAEGKAVPMIVVIANGNVSGAAGGTGYADDAQAAFRAEISSNIIPYVDGRYRTYTDARRRALCGLSMGGGQSFYSGLGSPLLFANVGMFSSGLYGRGADAEVFDVEAAMPGILSDTALYNDRLELFYISCGEGDPRIEPTKRAVALFREKGLEVEFSSFPGGHEWQVWRKSLHDFAQKLFR